MRQEEAEEDDESYATRQDQLNLKPVRGNKGRGRGGKGRGRGRGSTIKEKNKAGKMSDDDWWNQTWIDEWGHPDEEQFSDGYGDSGYYWDRYAWYEGAESLEQLEPETKKGKGKKTPEKKEPSGKSKVKKDKDAKSKKPAQNAKTKDEKHEGPSKVKKDKTNAMPSAGSTSKKRKPACEKAADQSSEPAKKKKAKTAKAEENQPPPPPPRPSRPLIKHGGRKDIMAIRKFYKQYKDDESITASQDMKDLLKGNLRVGNLTECRLNIYWRTPACGVTSKTHSKDIAHFNFNQDFTDENYMTKLAITLKCAAMFVT
jgi:hypothetical protein